jgi:superfamily II DNA or RNA helicase
MVIIEKLNNSFIRIHCEEQSTKKEIEDFFSFTKPGFIGSKAQFLWLKKRNMKQPLFNARNSTLPYGLMPRLTAWLKKNEYEYKIEGDFNCQNFSEIEALEFIKSLNLPEKFVVRDYQLKYFIKCVRNNRAVVISPTNSGKSLIIYLLYRYFNEKTLLTVPITNLVYQMYDDFREYGYDVENNIHLLTPGQEKTTEKQLTICCWQSIYTQDKRFFSPFKMVIGDEVHTNKADSLIKIMNMMVNTSIRIGLTGSMTKVPLFDSQIEGCFGPVIQYVSNDDLIKQGFSSPILIKSIELHHNEEIHTIMEYQDEINFLLCQDKRNDFFVNLALSLKGNSFLMFRIKSHGQKMYEAIKEKATCPVYYIDGDTSTEERNRLKKIIDASEKCIVLASVVFATGVNISSINNIVFTHPTKSRIRVLQSIGRGLRLGKNDLKKHLTLVDVYDVIKDGFVNTTLKHAKERKKIYKQENFPVKEYELKL